MVYKTTYETIKTNQLSLLEEQNMCKGMILISLRYCGLHVSIHLLLYIFYSTAHQNIDNVLDHKTQKKLNYAILYIYG